MCTLAGWNHSHDRRRSRSGRSEEPAEGPSLYYPQAVVVWEQAFADIPSRPSSSTRTTRESRTTRGLYGRRRRTAPSLARARIRSFRGRSIKLPCSLIEQRRVYVGGYERGCLVHSVQRLVGSQPASSPDRVVYIIPLCASEQLVENEWLCSTAVQRLRGETWCALAT